MGRLYHRPCSLLGASSLFITGCHACSLLGASSLFIAGCLVSVHYWVPRLCSLLGASSLFIAVCLISVHCWVPRLCSLLGALFHSLVLECSHIINCALILVFCLMTVWAGYFVYHPTHVWCSEICHGALRYVMML